MKQTNNAIKFLMAQYRAIFKSAYFKGLATAVVVTAGLAATQAQAVDANDLLYSEGIDGKFVDHQGYYATLVTGRAAGAIDKDSDGIVSGGTLNIGSAQDSDNDFESSKNHVNGGYVSLGPTSSLDAIAQNNHLNLNEGAKIHANGSTPSNAIGGWAKTKGTGVARAENNHLFINSTQVTVSGEHIGAWASSIHGATAVDNSIELGNAATNENAHYVSSGSGGFYGAKAFVENEAVGGDFVTQGNSVVLDYVDVSGGSDVRKQIFGGYTYTNPHSLASGAKADSMQSIGNNVNLDHMTFGAVTDSDAESGLIVANGVVSESDKGTSAHVNGANGSLTLSNSTFYVTQVAGGYAYVKAGSATVENNTVEIVNSNFLAGAVGTSNAVRSGVVESTIKSGSSANLAVINNTLSYTHSGGGNNQIDGSVEAAKATLNYDSGSATKPQSGDIWNSSIQLKGNSATIGENITVSGGNVVGAVATVKSNSAIQYVPDVSLEQNTVTFNGSITGDGGENSGQVTAAWSDTGGTLKNNTVTINGSVTKGRIIAARAGSGRAYGNDTAGGPQYNELSNNSVKIESDAKIIGTDIYAALSTDYNSVALGNTVTVQGQVSNGSIYGGAGADSLIDLASNSTLKLNVETAGKPLDYHLTSDNVNLAGRVEVGNEATLNVTGYFQDGNDQTSKGTITYNTNSTTIASSATILNAGTIKLYGATEVADGASLHALSAGAQIEVNGDKLGSGSIVDGDFSDNALNKVSSLSKVGDYGSLKLSLNTLNSYLQAGQTYTDSTNSSRADLAGSINLASGGAIEFTDAVVDLSDLDYSNSKVQGKIQVETDLTNGGSIFRGDTINVSHKLATNGSSAEKYDDLIDAGLKVGGVVIEANTLNLGTNSLTSSQSADIQFGRATAKEVINFNAATSGKDANNGNVLNDGYHLTSEVVGSHYMLTNSQDGKLQYYTAQNGVVNGTVTLQADATDSGNLIIQNGNWTANGQITLASGGTLTVGDDDGITPPAGVDASGPDATLTLNQALVLDLSNGTTAAISNIKVSGDGLHDVLNYADELDGTVSAKTERVALLDLRNGLTMSKGNNTTYNGKAVFDVTNSGIVLLSADDVNTILAQNDSITDRASGTFFTAHGNGAFIVDGDIVADFNDFRNDAIDTANGFNLSGDGILAANKLTVEHANNTAADSEHNDRAYIESSQGLNIAGNLYVADLEINDLQLTNGGKDGKDKPADAGNYASVVKIANGTAYISKSLTSVNQTLALKGNSGLVFETDAVKDKGTVAVDILRADDSGSITFENGEWTANAINLSGANSYLRVGEEDNQHGYDEDINGNDTYTTLDATSLTMAKGSRAYIEADGTANFKTADLSALDGAADYNNAAIQVEGELSISDSVKFGKEGSIALEKNGKLALGSKAVNESIIKDGTYTTGTVSLISGSTFTKIRNNLGGELYLDLGANTVFGGDQVKAFKQLLFTSDSFADGVLVHGGVLNIGKATFQDVKVEELVGPGLSGYTATWDSLRGFSDIFGEDVTNDTLVQTNVSAIKPGDNIQGHWGSLSMEKGVADSAQVQIAGNTSLNFAAGNNGFFISNADHSKALGADIQSRSDLTLEKGGIIGQINMQAGDYDAEKNLTVLNVKGPNKTTIASIMGEPDPNGSGVTGSIAEATLVSIQGGETEITKDLQYINEVEVLNGAYLNVKGKAEISDLFTLNSDAKFDTSLELEEATIAGGTTEAKDIIFNGIGDFRTGAKEDGDHSVDVVNGGLLKAETFTFKEDPAKHGNGALVVGYDLDENDATLENGTKITGTGYLEISKYLDLNGGTLVVDPAYGEATSVAAVMNFKDGSDTTYETQLNDVGIVDGSALVGKNAALGIGATLAETKEAIAKYQTNGSLSEKDYGSILYLNGQVTLTADAEIALNSAATVNTVEGIRDSLKYNLKQETTEDLRQDQYADLGLGANTAILMTEQAFISDTKGTKNGVAITFDQTNAVVNGQGGDIVLIGSFDAKDPLNFFMDKDGEGHQGALIAGQDINVYTQNGFLYTVLKAGTEAGYGEQLKVDTERAYAVMNEASNPVVETLISYHVDRGGAVAGDTTTESTEDNNSGSSSIGGKETTPLTPLTNATALNNTARDGAPIVGIGSGSTENTGDTTPPSTEDTGNTGTGGGADVGTGNGGNSNGGAQQPEKPSAPTTRVTGSSDFLNEVVTTSHGAPAEAAARLAIYGGAVQAAMAATSSTTDAIAARMGVGNTANITMANNGQGAALWLAPVYKTHDSDSFDSQGLDYGVDLNLYGVALGADFEFMPGLTAGIMFNVGSGDADGQGNAAANNTSNDFDYWGAAIYGNYTYDALSVTADVSYTAVDNDLEATTGMQQYSKLESSTDTTAISLGVTAKYTFDFGGVEVAPHAGLRYTNIDLDDYSIKSNGETIADYSADKVNIFSIPVGVTFAKEFTGDAWTVKPSLDLTLTGNFGDDDISGDVSWTGVDGLVTPVSSEYMDDFTYGATLGIEAASTGGFSLGLGVNYTGSSNVDEFGVNANARFVF